MKKFLISIALSFALFAGDYAVVTSKETKLSAMQQDEIKDVFLKKKQFVKGVQLLPINLATDSAARKIFEQKVIKMDRDELNEYWTNEHYRGIVPPPVQKSQASVKMFLKNIKGSIAYVDKKEIDDSLRVLYEF